MHRLLVKSIENMAAVCVICGPVRLGKESAGKYQCGNVRRLAWEAKGRPRKPSWHVSYRRHKKAYCERCGFEPEDPVQLDVDHIDGDHTNDDLENLRTLCANCHRLITKRNGYRRG